MFEEIIDAAKGKQIVMFLDYDGTLSPIVDDPDRAFMSRPVSPSFLASVHHNFIHITFFFLLSLSVTELCLLSINSDEKNSEKTCHVFSHCYCDWEVQR